MQGEALNIGVDVGGTNIKVGLIDGQGRIFKQRKSPTYPQNGPAAMMQCITDTIGAVLEESQTPLSAVASIGVGVPGTADTKTGTVVYAPNIFWRNVELGDELRDAFGVPIHVAQDTRAAAWAEYLVGEGQGMRSVAAVTLGTGVGCGMVFDGRIFHGAMNTAGEFGHQIVEFQGHACNCGRCGCLEAHAGGLAIVREAQKRIPDLGERLSKAASAVTVDDVYSLAQANHPQARALTDAVVKYVGIGLVNLINLNSVEIICLSGGISNAPAELLLHPLIAFVRANAYDTVAERVRVCRSTLGEDAPLIGASMLSRHVAETPRTIA